MDVGSHRLERLWRDLRDCPAVCDHAIDSLLGATLQQRGIFSNNGVNVVSTAIGGIVAGAIWMALA